MNCKCPIWFFLIVGTGGEFRNLDLCVINTLLFLWATPALFGAPGGTRTLKIRFLRPARIPIPSPRHLEWVTGIEPALYCFADSCLTIRRTLTLFGSRLGIRTLPFQPIWPVSRVYKSQPHTSAIYHLAGSQGVEPCDPISRAYWLAISCITILPTTLLNIITNPFPIIWYVFHDCLL